MRAERGAGGGWCVFAFFGRRRSVPHCNLHPAILVIRQTRKYVQSFIKPGLKMIDICERLEASSRVTTDETVRRTLNLPPELMLVLALALTRPIPLSNPRLGPGTGPGLPHGLLPQQRGCSLDAEQRRRDGAAVRRRLQD